MKTVRHKEDNSKVFAGLQSYATLYFCSGLERTTALAFAGRNGRSKLREYLIDIVNGCTARGHLQWA